MRLKKVMTHIVNLDKNTCTWHGIFKVFHANMLYVL